MKKFSFKPAFDATTMTIQVSVSNLGETPDFVEINWPAIINTVRLLIEWRVKHCEQQLAEATLKGETSYLGDEPHTIFYKNGGHFSIPTYQTMIEFLSIESLTKSDLTPGIAQQALRQYMRVLATKNFGSEREYKMLRDTTLNNLVLLESILTEILLCGTPTADLY